MLQSRSLQASREYQLLPANIRKSEAAKLPGSISCYQGTAENQKPPSFQGVSAVTREQPKIRIRQLPGSISFYQRTADACSRFTVE